MRELLEQAAVATLIAVVITEVVLGVASLVRARRYRKMSRQERLRRSRWWD